MQGRVEQGRLQPDNHLRRSSGVREPELRQQRQLLLSGHLGKERGRRKRLGLFDEARRSIHP